MENTLDKETKEKIHDIEMEITYGLGFYRGVMMESSVLGWGIHLNFTKEDAFNAIYIMNSILSNIAIKSGFISSQETAETIGIELKKNILKMFGIDTEKLIQ